MLSSFLLPWPDSKSSGEPRTTSGCFWSQFFASDDFSEAFDFPFLFAFPFPIIFRSGSDSYNINVFSKCKSIFNSLRRGKLHIFTRNFLSRSYLKTHLKEFHGADDFLALFSLGKLSDGGFTAAESRIGSNGLSWVVNNLDIMIWLLFILNALSIYDVC